MRIFEFLKTKFFGQVAATLCDNIEFYRLIDIIGEYDKFLGFTNDFEGDTFTVANEDAVYAYRGKNSLVKIYDLEKENEKANEGVNLDNLNRKSVGGDINGCEYGSYKYCEVPNDPADISCGYLIEFELNERYASEKCGFVTSRGQPVIIKCPEVCSKAEVEYIRDYVQRVEDAVYSSDGKNSNGEHYGSLIDVDSFTKVYLINEISMNLDATATSFFMYLDKDSLLKAGPIWDFDWALGSYQSRNGFDLSKGTGWYVRNKKIYGNDQKDLIATLCSHDDFWNNVNTVWNN